ncbi:MAG: hypothetical protein AB7V40_01830 [Methyloceanibacter sp.]
MKSEMKFLAIAAGTALIGLATLISPVMAGSDDVYWWCWKQADYVRPALDPRGKEGWVANCVADHTPPLTGRKKKRTNNY